MTQHEDQLVLLHIRIGDADGAVAEIERELGAAGAEVARIASRGLSGLTECVVTASVGMHGVLHLVDVVRRMFQRGLVIDDGDGDLVIRSDPNLRRGMMVIRSRDGEITVREREMVPLSLVRDLIDRQGKR